MRKRLAHLMTRMGFLLFPLIQLAVFSSLFAELIKLRKSHLGNSSKLKRVFFLVARQRLSKLIFTLTPASVDCTRFGVGSAFSFNNVIEK